jgi:spore maturation protein CgeB
MKIVIFGLTISSSWGNGHATLWRGLCHALGRQGHRVTFFERNTPYYASNRDLYIVRGGELVIYDDWADLLPRARRELADTDAAIVTSYCPDALSAADLIQSMSRPLAVFYDLDTPVTLSRLQHGEAVPYIGPGGLAEFDLVLSYTGGLAIETLRRDLGARHAIPLYGHVDPDVHRPVASVSQYAADLSYLGTYSADRQDALKTLFIAAAQTQSDLRFLIGGAQYPQDFPWVSNIFFVRHLPPSEHPAFFSSSRLSLNVTRRPMAEMGWCPSGRLFEATACGAAVISDDWPGLDMFFAPGEEILVARNTEDVLAALQLSETELRRVANAGRARTLAEHTSAQRARELVAALESAAVPSPELERA